MGKKKTPGYSGQRDKKGNLIMPAKAKYVRFPASLLNHEDFLSLDPIAVKIYLILLRTWRTYNPDEAITISYDRLQELCGKDIPDKSEGEEETRRLLPGLSTISKAIGQLEVKGFIHKVSRHKTCNEYWIEQKWFTGEYK